MQKTKTIIEDTVTDESFYNVIMHNDDITPFDYVIAVLNQIFGYDIAEGLQIAMHIHQNGKAVVATTSMKEAYEKSDAVEAMNEMFGMMLQTTVEKD